MEHLVVIGISGSGKSTVGGILAARLGWALLEADQLHSSANVKKMSAGIPLTDDDRRPWLDQIVQLLQESEAGPHVVICSALRRSYRDRLRDAGSMIFVHLNPDRDTVTDRLRVRTNHFMPPSLLQSQMDAMELLDSDERGIELDGLGAPDDVADRVIELLLQHPDIAHQTQARLLASRSALPVASVTNAGKPRERTSNDA